MATSPPPQRNRMVAVLGGLVVAVLGVVGTVYLSRTQSTTTGNNGGGGTSVTVVIARVAIPQGSKVTLDNLTTASVSPTTVPGDALKTPADANGLFAAIDISANQTLQPSLLVQAPSTTPGTPINPIRLADTDVAMAIPNDALKGAGGFIQAGDHIDIMVDLNGNGNIKYGFQNVPVIKSGSAGHAEGASSDLLVVALPRRQAEQLSVILGGKGTPTTVVRYVLRPASQNSKGYLSSGADTPDTASAARDTAVTPQQLNQLFGP